MQETEYYLFETLVFCQEISCQWSVFWGGFYITLCYYQCFGYVTVSHLYPDLCKDLYIHHTSTTHLEVIFSMHF